MKILITYDLIGGPNYNYKRLDPLH